MKKENFNYATITDEEAMYLYQQGDFKAFELIYMRHSSKVYNYLKGKKLSQDIAQELVQDVFEKLHVYRNKYKVNLPFLPWMYAVTKNTLLDHYKKAESKLIHRSLNDSELLESLAEPLKEFSSDDFTNLLDGLSSKQKTAMELRYKDEWSFQEIADALKTSEDNIRQIISRTVRRLRISLNKRRL